MTSFLDYVSWESDCSSHLCLSCEQRVANVCAWIWGMQRMHLSLTGSNLFLLKQIYPLMSDSRKVQLGLKVFSHWNPSLSMFSASSEATLLRTLVVRGWCDSADGPEVCVTPNTTLVPVWQQTRWLLQNSCMASGTLSLSRSCPSSTHITFLNSGWKPLQSRHTAAPRALNRSQSSSDLSHSGLQHIPESLIQSLWYPHQPPGPFWVSDSFLFFVFVVVSVIVVVVFAVFDHVFCHRCHGFTHFTLHYNLVDYNSNPPYPPSSVVLVAKQWLFLLKLKRHRCTVDDHILSSNGQTMTS